MPKAPDLTPQESEQLSQYASDDNFVQTQKEDIQELTNLFRSRLEQEPVSEGGDTAYPELFRKAYHGEPGIRASYYVNITEPAAKGFRVVAEGNSCRAEEAESAVEGDVIMSLSREVLEHITSGRMTFQRAFMAGSLKLKGDFRLLRRMDQLFPFMEDRE